MKNMILADLIRINMEIVNNASIQLHTDKQMSQKHITVYRKFFGIGEQDKWPCEHCGSYHNTEIHHIFGRGPGRDIIENCCNLCRPCHSAAHAESKVLFLSKSDLILIHRYFIQDHKREYRFDIEKLNLLRNSN